MKTFRYKGVDEKGVATKGVVEAVNETEALNKAREHCSLVNEIHEIKSGGVLSLEIGSTKISLKEIAVLCSEFAIILRAGVPTERSLAMVAEETKNSKLRKILMDSSADVTTGRTMADAFTRNGEDALPPTFIEMVRAGEGSGTLDSSFERMKGFYSNMFSNREKVHGALTYPIFVMVLCVAVLVVIMTFVIPSIAQTFEDLGGELPAMTQITVSLSDVFVKYWMFILMFVIALVVGIRLFLSSEKGKVAWGKMLMTMPIIGNINRLNIAAEFGDTMSVLLYSGLMVNQALRVTARVLNNYVMQNQVREAADRLEEGVSLKACLDRVDYFPSILREMAQIGENTGSLDSTLNSVAEYYHNEADYATSQALSKLEPAMTVILAVIVGFLVISVYLPMFTMYDLF